MLEEDKYNTSLMTCDLHFYSTFSSTTVMTLQLPKELSGDTEFNNIIIISHTSKAWN